MRDKNEVLETLLYEWQEGNTIEVAYQISELYRSNNYCMIIEIMNAFKQALEKGHQKI